MEKHKLLITKIQERTPEILSWKLICHVEIKVLFKKIWNNLGEHLEQK